MICASSSCHCSHTPAIIVCSCPLASCPDPLTKPGTTDVTGRKKTLDPGDTSIINFSDDINQPHDVTFQGRRLVPSKQHRDILRKYAKGLAIGKRQNASVPMCMMESL